MYTHAVMGLRVLPFVGTCQSFCSVLCLKRGIESLAQLSCHLALKPKGWSMQRYNNKNHMHGHELCFNLTVLYLIILEDIGLARPIKKSLVSSACWTSCTDGSILAEGASSSSSESVLCEGEHCCRPLSSSTWLSRNHWPR